MKDIPLLYTFFPSFFLSPLFEIFTLTSNARPRGIERVKGISLGSVCTLLFLDFLFFIN